MSVHPRIVLEPAAQDLADATAKPPYLYDLGPEVARKVLDDLQAAPVDKLPIDEEWITVPAAVGDVRVRIVRPKGSSGTLPVVVYMHGGGWILGNAGTHDRLVRELAVGARAAVAFVEYTPSPEAQYPVAIEQGYATAQWITREGASHGLDATRMAVAGESVGGNMTAALALMAKQRGDVAFVQQSMYYPVTDAAMNTDSYDQFATGFYLSRASMEWFWDAYTPDHAQRSEITASPNQASLEQVTGLPPALLFVDEADVLRDEGEAYARKLSNAGVRVTSARYNGTIHDFVMLNALADTPAARGAIAQAVGALKTALG
jgi:acetyl esterase/lipase